MRILVVDDDKATLRLLGDKIKDWGYSVYPANNGTEAWERLESNPVDIVLSDLEMPDMDGFELCRQIRNANFRQYIYVIFISGRDTQQDIIRGLEGGADDYLIKPVNFDELQARIEIGGRIISLEKELNRKADVINKNYFQTIHMFSNLLEVFNEELGGHCRRVAELSLRLAKRHPDLSEQDYQIAEAVGFLHDIGMVGLPSSILSKKRTEMNGEERELYLSHPALSEIILKEIEFLWPIAKLVRAHHEQVNGLGFPDGLSGKEIPLISKIVSAASVYDNLVHRGKIPLEDVHNNLQRMSGYQLEPAIVDLLLEINLENIQEEKEKVFLELDLDDLTQGMVLAKDVRMKSGAIVMPARMELKTYSIDKLKSYRQLACVSNKVYVCK